MPSFGQSLKEQDMTHRVKQLTHCLVAGVVGGVALVWNGNIPTDAQTTLISTADARVGRPATPVSYAGVARRTTRRAVAAGTVAGATAVGVTAATAAAISATAVPRCGRVVDRYGRVVVVCP
jgi:hypothetical protein